MMRDSDSSQASSPPRRWFVKKRFWIPCAVIVVLAGYLTFDYYGPLVIPLREDVVWGLQCSRAEDLVVQDFDPKGHMWATRGMWAYRCAKGDKRFIRQYHVPTGFSMHWLRNFTLVRWLTKRAETVDLVALENGGACAMSAGHMWYRTSRDADFKKTFTLPHYGYGVGRGIRYPGLTQLSDGTVLIGEYFRNSEKTDVHIYSSPDGGKTWKTAYTFPAGQIRHIHAVQYDPYADKVWVCTGDKDSESIIARSSDRGRSFTAIGEGEQMWRSCMLGFTEDAVYWGADAVEPDAGFYRWDRATQQVTKLVELEEAVWSVTELAAGTLVFQDMTAWGREDGEKSRTRLWVGTDGKRFTRIDCAKEIERKSVFPILRFPRSQGGEALWMTCLKVEKYNWDLLMIPEKVLVERAGRGVVPGTTTTSPTRPGG